MAKPSSKTETIRLLLSTVLTEPARSMLRAVGFTDEDFTKSQIGIASSPSDLTPCNMHLGELASHATNGVNHQEEKQSILVQLRSLMNLHGDTRNAPVLYLEMSLRTQLKQPPQPKDLTD